MRPHWIEARAAAKRHNAEARGLFKRGVGVAGMWYGCGNTSMSNPSTMRLGFKPNGRFDLFQGAVDIGQGSNTVIAQICADALGAPIGQIDLVSADTDITPDCGKTSASRQTFVSGNAAALAGRAMRRELLRLANVGEDAKLRFETGSVVIADAAGDRRIELAGLPINSAGFVVEVAETFDPPTTPLDENGQGDPYAVFGSGAHMAEVEVDVELGRVKVLRLVCAHDVGRAINPTLVEGQIEGGAAQGLGLALMEEFSRQGREPARLSDPHDRRHAAGRVHPDRGWLLCRPVRGQGHRRAGVDSDRACDFNAIHHATGVRMHRAPATPDRVRKAILEAARTRQDRGRRQDPLRRLSGHVLHPAGDNRRLRPLREPRWPIGTGPPAWLFDRTLSEGGKAVPFVNAESAWSGDILRRPVPLVTAVGAGTTYPDYKPAPFIVSSKVAGVDMVTVVTEGIYSYCGIKLKIDTDRHLAPNAQLCAPRASRSGM